MTTGTAAADPCGPAHGACAAGAVGAVDEARPRVIVVPDAESAADAAEFRRLFAEAGADDTALRVHVGEPASQAAWIARVADADAVILNWTLPDAVFAAAPRLRAVSFLGTGAANHVNLALAADHGVTVTTVAGYADTAVAEHTLALLLAAARAVPQQDRDLAAGEWRPRPGMQLAGKQLGLIGYGGIARRVAHLAQAFGMRVCAWTRSGRVDGPATGAALDDLLGTSDVVSLHLALTPDTQGFLGADRIGRLRPGAILVNTARGQLVDEAAVTAALDSGALAAYASDVFAVEPVAGPTALTRHPRSVCTPHVAYATPDAESALLRAGIENAVAALRAAHRAEPVGTDPSWPAAIRAEAARSAAPRTDPAQEDTA